MSQHQLNAFPLLKFILLADQCNVAQMSNSRFFIISSFAVLLIACETRTRDQLMGRDPQGESAVVGTHTHTHTRTRTHTYTRMRKPPPSSSSFSVWPLSICVCGACVNVCVCVLQSIHCTAGKGLDFLFSLKFTLRQLIHRHHRHNSQTLHRVIFSIMRYTPTWPNR